MTYEEAKTEYPDASEYELNEIVSLTQPKGGDAVDAKVLLLDIETSPNLGWVWGKWQQDVIDFENEWHILCFSYKWLNQKRVHTVALTDFKEYKKDRENDKKVIEQLKDVLDEADVVIAHNGDNFDIPRINTRFVFHNITPPAPYKTIDTLKVAKQKFGFNSNKLDDIGRYLGLGRKLVHTGFALWKGCVNGDESSWRTMKKYNANDIVLLERVYLKLRPWMTNHPNFNVYSEMNQCPTCQSDVVQKRGFSITATGRKQRYQCQNPACGAWSHGTTTKVAVVR